MPVLQHEVHSSVIEASEAKYGCNNKPRSRKSLMVKDGLAFDIKDNEYIAYFRRKVISDFGSLECRYAHSLSDSKCLGCCHRGSGEAYNEFIRNNGS
jgi:hypothetical protein